MREALITFLTKRKKNVGQTLKVRFKMEGMKPAHLDLRVQVSACRPTPAGKQFVCSAMAYVPEEKLAELEEAMRAHAQRGDQGMASRRSQRLPISLRVMARELPGFGAVTVDISQHGVRLNCHGMVKQGAQVNMVIESDVASVENMQLRGRIVWARENTLGKGWLAGLEFFDLTPYQEDCLERYCKALAGRLRGNVMHRQIADGEIVVRPEENEDGGAAKPSGAPAPPSGVKPLPPPPGLPPLPPPPPPPR